jgi:acyl carrier protein
MQADMALQDTLARVMALVKDTGQVGEIGPDDDFYDAGFTSLRSLELLLQLEAEWNVSIPDEAFVAARTVRSLGALLDRAREDASCD